MKEACAYAGSKGIFLTIENHGYLTETADDLMKLLDGVSSEWLGINLDTGNFHGDPYENIAHAAPHAVTCQIKTMIRKPNSEEREPADLARIIQILRDARYRGYLALEYEGNKPHEEVPVYIQKLQALTRT
jgi:sugar phosphate isomerase/epimerase